jgi:hypothetical protein
VLEADREVAHRQLRLAVHAPGAVLLTHVGIIGIDRTTDVLRRARQRHDPCPRRGLDDRQETPDERPVPEHVDRELGVEPVLGRGLRRRHDPGIAHQDVEPVVRRCDPVGSRLDRGERSEIEFDDLERGGRMPGKDLVASAYRLVLIARRHHETGTLRSEHFRRCESEPAVRAGDDGDLPGEIRYVVRAPGHGQR